MSPKKKSPKRPLTKRERMLRVIENSYRIEKEIEDRRFKQDLEDIRNDVVTTADIEAIENDLRKINAQFGKVVGKKRRVTPAKSYPAKKQSPKFIHTGPKRLPKLGSPQRIRKLGSPRRGEVFSIPKGRERFPPLKLEFTKAPVPSKVLKKRTLKKPSKRT